MVAPVHGMPAPGGLDLSLVTRARIVVIGLGGIGSILATYLCLFLASLRTIRARLVLVDGDAYEARNRDRMEFAELENKAVALCRSLERRFGRPGLTIRPVDRFVSKENVVELIDEGDLVFSCVDNHATRKLIGERCEGLRDAIVISGGNDGVEGGLRGTYGNVQVFVRKGGADITAPLGRFHPEIAEPKDRPPSASCEALAAASAPQILFTNLAAASAMCGAFYRLLRTDLDEPMHDEACFDILDARMVPHRLSEGRPLR